MSHNPVNHPARPIYRAIGGLIGVYLVVFGVLGVLANAGKDLLAQDDTLVLGQGANLGSSVLLAVFGVIVLIGAAVGRNVDVAVNRPMAWLFLAIGLGELAVLRTDANVLNFSVATCVVLMVLGLALLMVAMYGRVGTEEEARAFQEARLIL
jgi:hypothetical protein